MSGNTKQNGNVEYIIMPILDHIGLSQDLHLQLPHTQTGNSDTSIWAEGMINSRIFDISGASALNDIDTIGINGINTHSGNSSSVKIPNSSVH